MNYLVCLKEEKSPSIPSERNDWDSLMYEKSYRHDTIHRTNNNLWEIVHTPG